MKGRYPRRILIVYRTNKSPVASATGVFFILIRVRDQESRCISHALAYKPSVDQSLRR